VFLPLEDWFLFRPTPASREWHAPPNGRVRDVEWQLAGGPRIHAWWCPTEGWRPEHGAVLYFHGNAGNVSLRGEGALRWQQELGLAVLLPDYAGYGRSTGRPSEAGCYAAADAAYEWLVLNLQVPADRILLYGGSLGCAVAVDLAARRPCRALVLVSPFTSVRDMARQVCPFVPPRWVHDRFDNLAKVPRVRRPVFIAHGTADRLVPFAQGERLFAAANPPKEFFAMRGYEHHHSPGPEFYARLREFLGRTASLPPAAAPAN
jgi:uncharacterized protein